MQSARCYGILVVFMIVSDRVGYNTVHYGTIPEDGTVRYGTVRDFFFIILYFIFQFSRDLPRCRPMLAAKHRYPHLEST